MKIRVYYEDTDIGGIVYHSKYINFCERARSELLFQRGIKAFDLESQSGFVVKNIDANFLKTATLGDMLDVETSIKEQSRVTLTLNQKIYKENELIFDMDILLVYVKNMKPAKVPDVLVEHLD